MKTFFSISIFLLTGLVLKAQSNSSFEWHLLDSIQVPEESTWTVDILQNNYVSSAGVVNKYDSTGLLKFSQSIKSLGELSDMVVINTMKLVYFSSEQQVLCYLDNTLARNEDCLQLDDRDIVSAILVARSDRSNKLWVFDDINSKLLLIDLQNESVQPSIIENLRSIIGEGEIQSLSESGGQLYINCPGRGVFVFDLYGSLIEKIDEFEVLGMSPDQNGVYLLRHNNSIRYYDANSDQQIDIPLPKNGIQDIKMIGSLAYLRSNEFVYKYSVEKSK